MAKTRWIGWVGVLLALALHAPADEVRRIRLESGGRLTFNEWPEHSGSVEYKVQAVEDLADEDWATLPTDIYVSGEGGYYTDIPMDVEKMFFRINLSLPVPPAPVGMVLVPGGTNTGTDPDFGAYSLTVLSFFMDQYAVTRAQWENTMLWALDHGYQFDNPGYGREADHPVHTISWNDAVKWCNARTEQIAGDPVYYTDAGFTQVYKTGTVPEIFFKTTSRGFRLPTDVERHYAARGGAVGRRFPWADTDDIQHARANYYSVIDLPYDTSPTRDYHPDYEVEPSPFTNPGDAFAPNGYGLYDIAGNVQEWCWNWLPGSDYGSRIVRGGNWHYEASWARVGARLGFPPNTATSLIGFRTVRYVHPPEN